MNANCKYYNKNQVAEMFGCSVRTVDRWRKSCGLPFFIVGCIVRFDPEQVKEWFENHEKKKAATGRGAGLDCQSI